MKDLIKKHIAFVLILAVFVPIYAKNQDKDAIFKLVSKSYTLNLDGSVDYRERKELKIFTTMTFDAFGETFIMYNPDFQKLTINESYTVKADGTIIESPGNAFNPMLPENCSRCERLNPIREMVVTHTALEHNATIVLDYTIHSENFFFHNLLEQIELSEKVPVEKYEISITTPEGFPLNININVENPDFEKNIVNENGFQTNKWTFSNLKPRPSDEYLYKTALPTLSFTTLRTPELFVPQLIAQNAFNKFSSNEITAFFLKYIADTQDDKEKILKVRDYIAENILTRNINPKYLNYVLASPEIVWNTNCALPIEKNLLLANVLKSLNYNADLVFLMNDLYSHISSCVRVDYKGEVFYISADDDSDLSLDYKFAPAYIINQDCEFGKIPSQTNTVNVIANISFDGQNVEKPTVTYIQKNVQSPKVKTLLPKETSVVSVISQKYGSYYVITLYDGSYGNSLRSENIHRNREYAIAMPASDESYEYRMNIPAGRKILTKSSTETLEIAGAKMLLETKVEGQYVTVTRKLTLPEAGIPAKDVKKFKTLLGKWELPTKILIQ